LAVDPLAGKYPDISPFVFVANSPLVYVDPDGKKIMVTLASGETVQYVPGVKPVNDDIFLNQVHEAVSYVMKNDPNNTFQNLDKSDNVVTISKGENATASIAENSNTTVNRETGQIVSYSLNSEISWDPSKGSIEQFSGRGAVAPSTILLHEAIHADRILATNTPEGYDKLIQDSKDPPRPPGAILPNLFSSPEENRTVIKVDQYIKKVNFDEKMKECGNYTSQQQAERGFYHSGSALYTTKEVNSITPAYPNQNPNIEGQKQLKPNPATINQRDDSR